MNAPDAHELLARVNQRAIAIAHARRLGLTMANCTNVIDKLRNRCRRELKVYDAEVAKRVDKILDRAWKQTCNCLVKANQDQVDIWARQTPPAPGVPHREGS